MHTMSLFPRKILRLPDLRVAASARPRTFSFTGRGICSTTTSVPGHTWNQDQTVNPGCFTNHWVAQDRLGPFKGFYPVESSCWISSWNIWGPEGIVGSEDFCFFSSVRSNYNFEKPFLWRLRQQSYLLQQNQHTWDGEGTCKININQLLSRWCKICFHQNKLTVFICCLF